MKKVKALVLLSGGLDSMLAVKILQEQGIEVTGIVFTSNFYNAERAKKAAKQINIPLKIVDISTEMLDLVKNPPSGHGKNLNPCIDCHALMIKKASEILKKENYQIITTGETLGQRPFSQNKQSLFRVAKLSGTDILRPLSAKLLPITKYEKKGLVNRDKLLDIEGRNREKQMELAKKFNIQEYFGPGGGCILTEPDWSRKLSKMLSNWPKCDIDDVELLKHGRSFWVDLQVGLIFKKKSPVLIIIGRDKKDNEQLEKMVKKNDIIIEPIDISGPTTLVRVKNKKLKVKNRELSLDIPEKLEEIKNKEEVLKIACLLTGWYIVKARGRKINFQLRIIN